jgi:hypothetical protein
MSKYGSVHSICLGEMDGMGLEELQLLQIFVVWFIVLMGHQDERIRGESTSSVIGEIWRVFDKIQLV